MIGWKQKLSSRKLWLGVAIVIIGVVLCCTGNVDDGMILITTGCCGYLGCEMLVDIFRIVFSCGYFNRTETGTGAVAEATGESTEGGPES